ncbi:MAG: gspG, partial [Alphaproteobacteria bacterium]|nr:gspG [Alphaproteobacteria bacterium]
MNVPRKYRRHSSESWNLAFFLRGRKGKESPAFAGMTKRRDDGFTLVEMMVVLVIIGLLATVVIINVLPATERAARTRVQTDLSTLEQAIEMYRLENLRYPTNDEGLAALTPNYVRRLPNDPWGTPYVYVSPGANGAPYRIASLGADKREGGSGENA